MLLYVFPRQKKICSWKPFVSYSELSRGDVDISHLYNLNF